MRRVNRQRRQHGEYLIVELLFQKDAVGGRDLLAGDNGDAFLAQLTVKLGPDALLVGNQARAPPCPPRQAAATGVRPSAEAVATFSRIIPIRPATRTM